MGFFFLGGGFCLVFVCLFGGFLLFFVDVFLYTYNVWFFCAKEETFVSSYFSSYTVLQNLYIKWTVLAPTIFVINSPFKWSFANNYSSTRSFDYLSSYYKHPSSCFLLFNFFIYFFYAVNYTLGFPHTCIFLSTLHQKILLLETDRSHTVHFILFFQLSIKFLLSYSS